MASRSSFRFFRSRCTLARDRQHVEPALFQLDRPVTWHRPGVMPFTLVGGQQVRGGRLGLRLIPVASGVRLIVMPLAQGLAGYTCGSKSIGVPDAIEHEHLVTLDSMASHSPPIWPNSSALVLQMMLYSLSTALSKETT